MTTPDNPLTLWGAAPLDIAAAKTNPPAAPPMILPGFKAGTVGVLYGGGGGGKSFLSLHIAAAVATGNKLFAWDVSQGPVVLIQMEDDTDEMARRIRAIEQYETFPDGDLYIYPASPPKPRLLTAAGGRGEPPDRNDKALRELYGLVQSVQARLVILDPLIRLHALDENANSDMIHLTDTLDGLARTTGAGVLLVHHTTKAGRSGGGDNALARGAGVLTDEARWAAELGPLTEKEAQGISESDRWKYLALRVTKCNYGPRPDPLYLYRTAGGALMLSKRPTPTTSTPKARGKNKVVALASTAEASEPDEIDFGPIPEEVW